MSDGEEDLDALFDEISAQRDATGAGPGEAATVPAHPPVAAAPVVASDSGETEVTKEAEEICSTGHPDKQMYERIGGILRTLHDSMRELGYDRSLSNVAHQITDAQHRLEHIASLTEQAANKVLNTVDTGLPEQEALSRQAQEMDERWSLLFQGKMSIEDFKTLATDSKQFAAQVMRASDAEKARLLDIMMAQDFQDITGQLIKKIVNITNTAEHELAQLLRDNAPPEVRAAMAEQKPAELMQGPSSPNDAMAQNDVDSLLADLGF